MTRSAGNEKCEQKQNLTKEEMIGLISLKKRIKDGSIVMMCMDKSNKFSLTDINTFRAMGAVHTDKQERVDRERKGPE